MNKETFPVAELIHDVVAKFDLKAQDKELQLSVSPNSKNAMVTADIGKLERVLTNLIENAIRHTPSGGHVALSIMPQADVVAISVQDSGVGIPEKELNAIFDRPVSSQ